MSTLRTQGNLPYPDGTEAVKDGDNAIGALAQALDTGWKTLTFSTGWNILATGIPGPRIRVGGGRLELGGIAVNNTVIPAGGSAVSVANPAIIDAVRKLVNATTGNYLVWPIAYTGGGATPTLWGNAWARLLADGRLAVYPAMANQPVNGLFVFEGISMAYDCTVAP